MPQNKRYSHIESKLDTGSHAGNTSYMTNKQYLKRRDELFYRITGNDLFSLYVEYSAQNQENIASMLHHHTSQGPLIVTVDDSDLASPSPSSSYSVMTLPSTSELDQHPYLILDVRQRDAYLACHLFEAVSFPSSLIFQDRWTPEVMRYVRLYVYSTSLIACVLM